MNFIYARAFHAMFKADLRNAQSRPETRTVTSMLRRLQKKDSKSVVEVIFDAKETFVGDIYNDTKLTPRCPTTPEPFNNEANGSTVNAD
jgi:hypothetical protein